MKHLKLFFIIMILLAGKQHICFSQYNAGDTLQFWSVTYIDWPPLQSQPQHEVNAICKKAGDHCYVFVEDNAPQPAQAKIDTLVHWFDYHFYDSLTTRYGPVPDVDSDPNIFILVLNESNWGGYFDPGQQMSDSMVYNRWNRHSSEREIIYISATSFSTSSIGITAHELGHMLHWNQDHSPEPLGNPVIFWEDTWVDEGFSTFATIYLTENIFRHNVLDNSTFFASNPDIPLIYFSNYNQVKLFMLFMFEHFGKWDYISALISNQLNGIYGIDSTLKQHNYTETFDDAFEQWAIANYADDSVYAGGKYSYAHYKFSNCYISANYTLFPTGLKNATITPYGADYITFTSSAPKPLIINFNGQLDSKFRIDLILKNSSNNHIDSIIGVPLDNMNHAVFIADGLGTTYDKAVMVVMNLDSTIDQNNTASYSYSADNYTGINDFEPNNTIKVFPNPANGKIFVFLSNDFPSLIEISDIQGRFLYNKNFIHSTNIDISSFAKGIYLLKITNPEEKHIEKILIE